MEVSGSCHYFMIKKKNILEIIVLILFIGVFSGFTRYFQVNVNEVFPPGKSHNIAKKYDIITYYNPENDGCVISAAVDSKTQDKIGKLSWGYIYADDVKLLLEEERTNKKILSTLEAEQEFLQKQLGAKYNAGTKANSEYGKEDYWLTAYYDFDLTEPYCIYEINFWAEDFNIKDKGIQKVLDYFGLDKCYDSKSGHFKLSKMMKNKKKILFGEIFDFVTDRTVVDMEGNVLEGNTESESTTSTEESSSTGETTGTTETVGSITQGATQANSAQATE